MSNIRSLLAAFGIIGSPYAKDIFNINRKFEHEGKDYLEDVDIEKEYELIQQKKSKLPAVARRMVIDEWERKQG